MGLLINQIKFTHFSGLPNVPKTALVDISLSQDKISFSQTVPIAGQKREELGKSFIALDQVVSGGIVTNLEAESSGAFGSALAGGLLFGMSGAIAGAMIGSNQKKTEVDHYFVLNYKSVHDGEMRSLYFLPTPEKEKNYRKFMADLKTVVPDFIDTDLLPGRYDPVQL